ncbi:HIT family protein [Alteribacillus iranensis]|uniref:Histidine triad (HIT) family protein n=1 Tax=Alteribacillus iranensis TaxID=930128 RepID=A0A1I1Z4N3_9BACI|nr:HIT family protein [Alteribacillus iranensis]SFE26627.1 histidine triad (HIT) family protein [Alteribacillus iranensis]
MSHDENCIFCKIVKEEIPASVIYEDDVVMAFADISQTTKGHTLLIPKEHQEDIYHLKEETASHLFRIAPKLANAIKEEFQPDGLNLVNNNGKAASQAVFHYHLHFIPRYGSDDGFKHTFKDNSSDYSGEALQQIADRLKKHL